MASQSDNNKRIAKNALFLYLRMFISLAVSLFTSRIVLHTLGVMDYGIWNVVGGVIGMFSFLNATMVGCTNRFLSFELGRRDFVKLQKVFSASLSIHILIALVIFLLAETVGLWFLQEKLVIPENRMMAANVIYQIVVLSSMLTIVQTPFTSMIVANEKMDVYAYIDIFNVCLRLVIVYMLYISSYDKLITYGVLNLVVSITVIVINLVYCQKKLQACRLRLNMDKTLIKPMLSFSAWDLYGNASVMARTQGVNMLLNMFFTATMNAASAIATSVQGAVMGFAGNVLSAFRPQIVKTYANGDKTEMVSLIRKAAVMTTALLLLFTLPLLLETDYVLKLWLKKPPAYAAILCRWVLIFNIIANLSSVVISGVHATGYIKRSSFINGTCYLLVIPFSYVAYRFGLKAEVAFIFNVIAVCIGMMQNVFVLNKYVPEFGKFSFTVGVIGKFLIVSAVTFIVTACVQKCLEESFSRLCITTMVSMFTLSALTYAFVMNRTERYFAKSKITSIIRHINK